MFLFFSVVFLLYSEILHAAWTEQIVDTTSSVHMSLDIDSSGRVHLSYRDQTNEDLRYAYFNGTNWIIQTVDSPGDVGHYTSLEVSASGYGRISYSDDGYQLKYASFNGTGWEIQIVTTENFPYTPTSLALDATGYGRVSFIDITSNQSYAEFNGTGWVVQDVAPGNDGSPNGSITLDSSGYARMSYMDVNSFLKYAVFNGTGWDIQTVDTNSGLFRDSIALNAQGYAQISYLDYYTETLKYASYNGTGWTIQSVDTALGMGGASVSSSLVLDSNGYAYITYFREVSLRWDLMLSHFNGTGWELETIYTHVAAWGGAPTDTAIALYNDYVYITYAQTGGELAVTTNAPAGFVPEPGLGFFGKIIFLGIPLIFLRRKKGN